MAKRKKRRLKKVDIREVSLVDAPATGLSFFFTKNADQDDPLCIEGFQLVSENTYFEGTPDEVAQIALEGALSEVDE